MIKIHNLETGEEIEREMTKAEYDQYLADQALEQEKAQAIAEKQAARQSALEKLAALGLTEAEIQALAS
jgi:uncharacterized protein YqfA (UPF0365 family)